MSNVPERRQKVQDVSGCAARVRCLPLLVCGFNSRIHLPSLPSRSGAAVSLNEAEVDGSGNGELEPPG